MDSLLHCRAAAITTPSAAITTSSNPTGDDLTQSPLRDTPLSERDHIIPWVEVTSDGIYARCPILEKARVWPYREKERNMSTVDKQLCYARLMRMAREGKVRVATPQDCHVILAPVLVDKCAERSPRVFTNLEDDMIHSRYRITIDCRPLNDLRLEAHEGGHLFVLPRPSNKAKGAANQSQQSGRTVLESLPLGGPSTCYAKIDLSDAFSSVRVPKGIGRLLSVVVPDLTGAPVAFSWECLPQGWRHSPFLFTTCVNAMLRSVDRDLETLGGCHSSFPRRHCPRGPTGRFGQYVDGHHH